MMAKEEFTVRITKKGEILIELDGMPVRRVKDLIAYFEETLGPARQVDTEGGDAGGGMVEIDDLLGREGEEEAAEEETDDRDRLRREDD